MPRRSSRADQFSSALTRTILPESIWKLEVVYGTQDYRTGSNLPPQDKETEYLSAATTVDFIVWMPPTVPSGGRSKAATTSSAVPFIKTNDCTLVLTLSTSTVWIWTAVWCGDDDFQKAVSFRALFVFNFYWSPVWTALAVHFVLIPGPSSGLWCVPSQFLADCLCLETTY